MIVEPNADMREVLQRLSKKRQDIIDSVALLNKLKSYWFKGAAALFGYKAKPTTFGGDGE